MKRQIFALLALLCAAASVEAQPMTGIYGRRTESLNGKWSAIVDPYDQGVPKQIFLNRTAQEDHEFFEYAWEGGLRLDVPCDWNSQSAELKYYEGTVWYARHIIVGRPAAETPAGISATVIGAPAAGERLFLYFGAVSYRCNVWLNGSKVCSHEGAFTPFEVEVTDILKEGDNFLAVEVNNRRTADAIPALAYDWWNYGGITRDVMIVRTPQNYVRDYFVRLDEETDDRIRFDVTLAEAEQREVRIAIPELGVKATVKSDAGGHAEGVLTAKKLKLWAPDDPQLYDVHISCGKDAVSDRIGFRRIEVDGTRILVNGVPTFMRCISFHEEIPQRMCRACTEADARLLLSEVEAVGANMVRLAHYPQNEHTVRMAEERGILLWEEIPLWQGIDFANAETSEKAHAMLREMIFRDRNRCAIGFWGIANETRPSEARDSFLKSLLENGRSLDSSRLFVAAFDNAYYRRESDLFEMEDDFAPLLDAVAINKYMGWYAEWPKKPSEIHWDICPDKPLIISEFGGEALYGQHGDSRKAASWSEEYQEQLYKDNLAMFANIPNLAGISPWILFDFRSPYRFHPVNQEGWNRKGILSDRGDRKRAWYVINGFYREKQQWQQKQKPLKK